MIKKIIRHLKKFIIFSLHFNPLIAVKLVILPIFQLNKPLYKRNAYKHSVIKKYLKRKLRKTINSFKGKHGEVDPSSACNYPVWFLWWQGEESMPPIVRACYETLLKNSGGHPVNLLTGGNFQDFVRLPAYILEKAAKNRISITHLSDVLRVSLLYEHGGLWIDSTVFLTAPLQPLPPICAHLGFWTPKDDGNILESCFGARNWIVREGKWLTFCFYSSRHNMLPGFVREMFFAYLKSKTVFIDYFLFDYFISIAYDAIPEIRVMIDSVPENNPKVHEIHHRLNPDYEYNKELFDSICSRTFFHKLNWKDGYKTRTAAGKLTNYGFILKLSETASGGDIFSGQLPRENKNP